MRGWLGNWLVLVGILLLAIPVAAQDSTPEATDEPVPTVTEVFTSNDYSLTFNYPKGWFVSSEIGAPIPYVWVSNFQIEGRIKSDEVRIAIAIETIDQLLNQPPLANSTATDIANLMRKSFLQKYKDVATISEVIAAESNKDKVQFASFQIGIESSDNGIWILKLNDSTVAVITAVTLPGELSQWNSVIAAIAASIVYDSEQVNLEATVEPTE